MLSQAENEYLCRVGPGTPMGTLLRRFWMPALIAPELPDPDCPPIRLTLLNEQLVAFRDSTGQVGLIANNCPHRGASLFFGRNEESGLRCVYHGWKFDTNGQCVDMPNEPAESDFKTKVRAVAYRGADAGGLTWIYMGQNQAAPPGLPGWEWCQVPENQLQHSHKAIYECNFMQALEGELDTTHVYFLHSRLDPQGPPAYGLYAPDRRARLEVVDPTHRAMCA